MSKEALYRDQNTGAERRSTSRLHFPYVLVTDEETKPRAKAGNGRRKAKPEEEEPEPEE